MIMFFHLCNSNMFGDYDVRSTLMVEISESKQPDDQIEPTPQLFKVATSNILPHRNCLKNNWST